MRIVALALLLLLGAPMAAHAQQSATAIFAGGCFWCMEALFEGLPGVIGAESGYTGGHLAHPSYEQVSTGTTGHLEAVRITYDPAKVSYRQLLAHYWHKIDPTDPKGQFCNVGPQYRSAIFYLDEGQKALAESSKSELEQSGALKHVQPAVRVASGSYPGEFQLEAIRHAEADALEEGRHRVPGRVYTLILPAATFYPAEAYHQDFHKKNPLRYRRNRLLCGRDTRLEHIWGRGNKK